jgi:hypothetical protein
MPWQTQQASDGVHYNVYRQDKLNSCACAALTMCARLIKNKTLNEATVRGWVAEAEGGFRTSREGVREFDNTATQRDLYGELFKKIDVTSFPVKGPDNVAKWIRKVNVAHPAIVSVSWYNFNIQTNAWETGNSGGHAIVALKVHNNSLIILDPGNGVVEIPLADAPLYTVTHAGNANPTYGRMEEMRTTF